MYIASDWEVLIFLKIEISDKPAWKFEAIFASVTAPRETDIINPKQADSRARQPIIAVDSVWSKTLDNLDCGQDYII